VRRRAVFPANRTGAVLHEREISNAGRLKLDFAERGEFKTALLGLSLAGNLVKPLISLYGTEWRERGYGLRGHKSSSISPGSISTGGLKAVLNWFE
jgi:hypothetical protein